MLLQPPFDPDFDDAGTWRILFFASHCKFLVFLPLFSLNQSATFDTTLSTWSCPLSQASSSQPHFSSPVSLPWPFDSPLSTPHSAPHMPLWQSLTLWYSASAPSSPWPPTPLAWFARPSPTCFSNGPLSSGRVLAARRVDALPSLISTGVCRFHKGVWASAGLVHGLAWGCPSLTSISWAGLSAPILWKAFAPGRSGSQFGAGRVRIPNRR